MEEVRRIIDNIYELEGLMREIEYRGEDAPDELYNAAGRKAELIARAVSTLHDATEPITLVPEVAEVAVPDQDVQPEPAPEPKSEPELKPELELEPEPESEPESAPVYVSETEPEPECEPVENEAAVPATPTLRHESIFDAPDVVNEAAPVPVLEPEQTTTDTVSVNSYDTPKADIRTMFTINDLFRFRRELFGNSEADMSDVLNMVMAMQSYEEAEEYFYGYLCWPPDNEQVADFMNIISQYLGNVR